MALNGSGPISLGGSTSGQSVNLELGNSATAQISFNDADVRTLTGTSAGTALIMPTNFYGKSFTEVTVGSYVLSVKGLNIYYYGYDNAPGGTPSTFGSISNGTYSGATIKAVYSISPNNTPNDALSYLIIFSGDRSAGFFTDLQIAGASVVGSIGAPSYSAGNDETSFTITPPSTTATRFGTTVGAVVSVAVS